MSHHAAETMLNRVVLLIPAIFLLTMNFLSRTLGQDFQLLSESLSVSTEMRAAIDRHRRDVMYNVTDSLKCYSCGAYRHSDKDEFEAKLKRCRDNYEDTAEIFKCPSYVAGQRTTPECGVS